MRNPMKALKVLIMATLLYGCQTEQKTYKEETSFALSNEVQELTVEKQEPLKTVSIQPELEKIVPEAPKIVKTSVKYDDKKQIECLARNVYFESRGEPKRGQYAVANVTMNRVKSKRFPNTVCGVVHQKNQFSWTRRAPKVTDNKSYKEALGIAKEVYYDEVTDYSKGAHYFHSSYAKPSWSRKFTMTISIGNHKFYRSK